MQHCRTLTTSKKLRKRICRDPGNATTLLINRTSMHYYCRGIMQDLQGRSQSKSSIKHTTPEPNSKASQSRTTPIHTSRASHLLRRGLLRRRDYGHVAHVSCTTVLSCLEVSEWSARECDTRHPGAGTVLVCLPYHLRPHKL